MNPRALWAWLVALAAIAAVYLPPILAGRFWAPGDGITQVFPQRQVVGWAYLHGELPFWNPYLFGGMPFFATSQIGMLSLPNWPSWFLGLAAGANVTVLLAFAIGLAGLAVFVRTLGLTWAAAATAGLVVTLGGFLTYYGGNPAMSQALGFLPWLLVVLERHALERRRRWLAGAALLSTAVVLCGHPQTSAYCLLVAGAYGLFRGPGRAARVTALVFGVAMALVQLLPTLDLVKASQRQAIDFDWLTTGSVPFAALPAHLFPFLFGSRTPSALFPVPLWVPSGWFGYVEGYVGPVIWLLALTALGRWREHMVRFWAAVALVGLFLTLGRHTPLYKLWALLPFLSQMPYPARHSLEMIVALAVLAAYGLSWLQTEPAPARRALARAGGVLAAAMGLFLGALAVFGPGFAARTQPFIDSAPGSPVTVSLASALALWQAAFWVPPLLLLLAWLLARRQPALLIVLVALDLWSFNKHQGVPFILPYNPAHPVLDPRLDWAEGRSLALGEQRYPDCKNCDILAHLQRYHYPDVTMLTGEPTINGYEAFLPARYGKLLGMDSFGHAGESDDTIWDPPHHVLDLMGLGTLRLERAIAERPEWRRRLASGRWQRLPDEGDLLVLRNRTALPHAWRVTSARVLTPAEVDAALRGQQPFAPLTEALVEAPLDATSFTPGPALAESPSLNRMALRTEGPGPGLVLIGSGYDAGWRAWNAEGTELPVVRADGVLTGVVVPAGQQTVRLFYEPPRWRLGVGLSLAAATLLLLWLKLLGRQGVRS